MKLEPFISSLLLAFVVALLYTMGWTFARFYFEQFQLGMLELEFPKEFYIVYAFTVVRRQWLVLLLLYPLYLILKPYRNNIFAGPVAIVLVGLLFFLFYHLGRVTGIEVYQEELKHNFPSFPNVEIHLNPSKNIATTRKSSEKTRAEHIKELQDTIQKEAMQKGCYRLILRNKGTLYLLKTPIREDNIPIEVLDKSKIENFVLLPKRFSC